MHGEIAADESHVDSDVFSSSQSRESNITSLTGDGPGWRGVTLSMGGLRMEMERKWEGNELGNGILNLKFKMGNYQDNDGMAW